MSGGAASSGFPVMHADDLTARPSAVSPAQRWALRAIRAYQLMLSPMYSGSCRFVPSCSAYAEEAIRRFGVVRGSWLAVRRLARCRPLAAHGFDPVPQRSAHD